MSVGRRRDAVLRRGALGGGALARRELPAHPGPAMSPAGTAQSSKGSQSLLVLLAALGVVAFLYGITRSQPATTWGIYLVNLLFWSSLAITGPAIAGMIQLTEARWSPDREADGAHDGGVPAGLLRLPGPLLRAPACSIPWVDDAAFRSRRPGSTCRSCRCASASVSCCSTGSPSPLRARCSRSTMPAGDSPAALARRNRLGYHPPDALRGHAVPLGLRPLMSIDPTWYSGLFGGYFVVTSLYTGFGLRHVPRRSAPMRAASAGSRPRASRTSRSSVRDVIFWMYFFYSQYLVIWYGNVPVETKFFLRRFFVQPWTTLAFAIFVVGALIPFAYLLKRLTGRPPTRHKVFIVILFMGWIADLLRADHARVPDGVAGQRAADRSGGDPHHRRVLLALRPEPQLVRRPLSAALDLPRDLGGFARLPQETGEPPTAPRPRRSARRGGARVRMSA